MAGVWQRILGRSHRMTSTVRMSDNLNEFVQFDNVAKVSNHDNALLMAPILEEEINTAIKKLERRKAGGPGGLNNDFYKDFRDDLMDDLLQVYNDIMQGGKPPQSFKEAIVIPLRKKGDSPDAMDYRPISLLQTSYKILAKVLATRLQTFLGTHKPFKYR